MKPYFHRRNLLYPRDPILGPVGDITTGRKPAYLGRVNFVSS